MDVSTRSVGELIDALITTNIKCFMAQDIIMDLSLTDAQRLSAAEQAQKSNAKRTALIRAIDKAFNEESFLDGKTYDRS